MSQSVSPRAEPLSAYLRRTRGKPELQWDVLADAVARLERIADCAREAVDTLNFYESTTGAYANEQRVYVLDALRRLRGVLDA